jgi:hypothetical protein
MPSRNIPADGSFDQPSGWLEKETRLAAFDDERALAALRTMRSVERC